MPMAVAAAVAAKACARVIATGPAMKPSFHKFRKADGKALGGARTKAETQPRRTAASTRAARTPTPMRPAAQGFKAGRRSRRAASTPRLRTSAWRAACSARPLRGSA